MQGRISQNFIDELLARSDLAELIGARINLKRTGKNFSALCPFHNEKSPSFSVNTERQFYYCFGCGAGGNALKFLMEYDNLEFVEAVETLARSQGMEVQREAKPNAGSYSNRTQQLQQRQQQDQRYQAMQLAQSFFQQQLNTQQGQPGLNYLTQQRGLNQDLIQDYALGLAPDSWEQLKTHLSNQGISTKQQLELGLLAQNQEGTRSYDRFRNRIIFPIRNLKGQTVGFGGRVLDDSKPKYLNSPETPLFQKSQELYGLYEARKKPGRLDKLLVVEGYMDVVALAQHGIHWAVATLGTAASTEHLTKIFRLVNEVVFCFDGDAAGIQAAARALHTLLPLMHDGRHARFLFLPAGEDPDTLIKKEGAGLFEQRINHALPLAEYFIQHLSQGLDLNLLDDQAHLAQLALPLLGQLAEGLLKQRLHKHLEQLSGLQLNPTSAQTGTRFNPAASNFNPSSSPLTTQPQPAKNQPKSNKPGQAAAEKLLGLLLRYPDLMPQVPAELQPEPNSLLDQLLQHLRRYPTPSTQVLLAYWSGTAQGEAFLQRVQQAAELDRNAAVTEIPALAQHLINLAAQQQTDAHYQQLLQRQQTGQLSTSEMQELWQLIQAQHQKNQQLQ